MIVPMSVPDLLNFRQIEAFKAVTESGSMTRAAELMRISQPAVSKLIAALENRVGFALFDRRPGKLHLTAEGRLFYEDIERALIGVRSLAEKADDIRERRYGRLTLGAMPALSWGLCQSVVADLLAEHPTVAISLQTRSTPQLLNLVQASQLDVAAVAHIGSTPLVHVESIHRGAMVCVVPAEHPLATRHLVTADDIAQESLIHLSTLDQARSRIELALLNAGVRPKSQIDTGLALAASAFVAAGLGVALVDPHSFASLQPANIAIKPFQPRIDFEIAIVRPVQIPPSLLTQKMIALLQRALDAADRATTGKN